MLRLLVVIVLAIAVTRADESRWVWGKNHRNQRAFDSPDGDRFNGNRFYGREKDREPTTRRPTTGQPTEEDLINPDDLRNYNGPSNFGYPITGPAGPAVNNVPPGYGAPNGVSSPQTFPSNGFPGQNGQPNYPTAPSGPGAGYPLPVPGGYPLIPNNGYQGQGPFPSQGQAAFPNQAQGAYPNQGQGAFANQGQGYPLPGPYPAPQSGGFPGFTGFPGIGNLFGLGNVFQGQGAYPGQNQGGQANIAGQGGYPLPGFGAGPYPVQGGIYPNQQGFNGQPGFVGQPGYAGQGALPNQYQGANGYPQQVAQYPTGQYVGCGGFPLCAGGQIGQGQYPAQYPTQYPGQYGVPYAAGQYPVPDPNAPFTPNPYGITPYNRGNGYATAFDDYDDTNKNGTSGSNRSLKAEGKEFSVSKSYDEKPHKSKKT